MGAVTETVTWEPKSVIDVTSPSVQPLSGLFKITWFASTRLSPKASKNQEASDISLVQLGD